MPWVYLFLAGVCEMAWPLGFKYTNGFRAHYPAIGVTIAIGLLSFWLLARATAQGIPIGTAYAVWTGLGACGTALLGIFLFGESRDFLRLLCIGLIIVGAVGLKFATPATE